MNDILLLVTGGTIDKVYDPATEKPEIAQESCLEIYLKEKIKAYPRTHIKIVCQKDSNDLTIEDRHAILNEIQSCDTEHIIITHGTSAMDQTAQFLDNHKDQISGRTIILTGAMIPLKEFVMSDGGFNLGYAFGAINYLNHGIYIAMHGRIFTPDSVSKNTSIARFEEA